MVDKINMKNYNTVDVAEVLGTKCMGETHGLCYTPKSSLAPRLLSACQDYMIDHNTEKVNWYGELVISMCTTQAGYVLHVRLMRVV